MSNRSSSRKSTAPAKPARGSGVQRVYEALRRAIVELDLPPGSPLDEVSLSQQFALSRTPVREALVRLAADGLVLTLPNRNTIVAPIDFAKLPVYFEALTLMYRVTTRSAALRRTAGDIAAIRKHQAAYAEAVAQSDAIAMIGTNRDFHVAIAEAGGNSYFTTLFSRLLDEGRRLLRLYYYLPLDDHLPHKYIDEHEAMIRAIERGEAERADDLAAAHASQIVRQIQSYIARDNVTGPIRLDDGGEKTARRARA